MAGVVLRCAVAVSRVPPCPGAACFENMGVANQKMEEDR